MKKSEKTAEKKSAEKTAVKETAKKETALNFYKENCVFLKNAKVGENFQVMKNGRELTVTLNHVIDLKDKTKLFIFGFRNDYHLIFTSDKSDIKIIKKSDSNVNYSNLSLKSFYKIMTFKTVRNLNIDDKLKSLVTVDY